MENKKTENKAKTPKLVCNITGQCRNTTREYLESRLARLNVTESDFVANYANKESVKLLREGKSVEQIRKMLDSVAIHDVSPEKIKTILAFNGKQSKLKVITQKPEAQKSETQMPTLNVASAASAAIKSMRVA